MRNFKTFTTAILALGFFSFSISYDLPKNWFKAGSAPDSYDMGLDKENFKSGEASAFIASNKNKIKGFGTLMQSCSAKKYLGQRIMLSGYVKSENIEGWSGLWLRIDGAGNGPNLGFDNMQKRAIKGTTDWMKYSIVMDVPEESKTLNFGALLHGVGKVWFDELEIEIVEKTTPISGKTLLEEPSNLKFEQ